MSKHRATIELTITLDDDIPNPDAAAENIASYIAGTHIWNDYGEHVVEVAGKVIGTVDRMTASSNRE